MHVTYFASIADLLGVAAEELDVPARTVGEVRAAVGRRHGAEAAAAARACVVLDGDTLLRADDDPVSVRVDLLPPFAGG